MQGKMNKRLLVLLLVFVMLFGGVVGGTLAWLTTRTETLVNTFTSGKIGLELAEPNWNPQHELKIQEEDEDGNIVEKIVPAYKFMPGDTIKKDPTVTVKADSAECYVRLFVVIWWQPEADSKYDAMDSNKWFGYKQYDDAIGSWTQNQNCISLYDQTNNQVMGIVNEYRYSKAIETSDEDQTLRPLFDYIKVPGYLETSQYQSLNNFKLTVFAQAVQTTGFANADAAFAAAGIPDVTLKHCVNSEGEPQTLEQIIQVLQDQYKQEPDTPVEN